MMRTLLIGLILAAVSPYAFSQNTNVCTISSVVFPSSLSEKKREKIKSTELAKIAVIQNNEGPVHSRTVKIPNTPLYAYVQILFDDNMDFFEGLAPAMNVRIELSSQRNHSERSIITAIGAQVAIDEYFKSDISLVGMWNRKSIVVNVTCVGPKPNE